MASVTGRLTINGIECLEVDTAPGGGTAAPTGSLASVADGSGLYIKTGAGDTAWSLVPTGAGTASHIAFYSSSGVLTSEGSGELYWDATNNRLGLMQSSPSTTLHVGDSTAVAAALISTDPIVLSGNSTAPGFSIVSAGASASNRAVFKGVRARGTTASPTAASSGDQVLSFLGAIYDGSTTQGTAAVDFYADGTVSAGVAPQRIAFSTSETNAAGRAERVVIKSNGNVGFNVSAPPVLTTMSIDGSTPASVFYDGTEAVLALNSAAVGTISAAVAGGTASNRGVFKTMRSRGSLVTPSVVVNNDYVLSLLGLAYDGSAMRATAGIEFFVDGTASVGNAPQRIAFQTGTTTSRSERVRITSAGELWVNELASSSTPSTGFGSIYPKTDGKLYFKNDGGTEYDLTESASGITGGGVAGQVAVFDTASTLTSYTTLTFNSATMTMSAGLVVNNGQSSSASYDLTAKTLNDAAALLVDASTNIVKVGSGTADFAVALAADSVGFYVDASANEVILGDTGGDVDLRVEGSIGSGAQLTHFFFVDASASRAYVNGNSGIYNFNVNGTTNLDGQLIVNDAGIAVDTRIESNNETHMLFVDGTLDRVGVGESAPQGRLHVVDTTSHVGTFERNTGATTGSMLNVLSIQRTTTAAALADGGGCQITFYGETSGATNTQGVIGFERHGGSDTSSRLCIGHYESGSYVEMFKMSSDGAMFVDAKTGVGTYTSYVMSIINDDATETSHAGLRIGIRESATDATDRFLVCTSSAQETVNGTTEFYVDGVGTTGTSLTVQHWAVYRAAPGVAFEDEIEPGMIVESTGQRGIHRGVETAIPVVSLCATARSPRVFGVLSSDWRQGLDMTHFTFFNGVYNTASSWGFENDPCQYDPDSPYFKARTNSGGEGQIWVTNVAGDIGNGDYVTSSEIAGHGARQDDDVLHSYTVAKCTEDVDWDAVSDTIDHGGVAYKRALVFCTYHCG